MGGLTYKNGDKFLSLVVFRDGKNHLLHVAASTAKKSNLQVKVITQKTEKEKIRDKNRAFLIRAAPS